MQTTRPGRGAAAAEQILLAVPVELKSVVEPIVALIATLPASQLEVASSEKGQEILDRLEKRFGRMSADVKPVADDEIYEVVRRRLFETLGDPEAHEKVADAYPLCHNK